MLSEQQIFALLQEWGHDPVAVGTSVAYLMLVLSAMMQNIAWLRTIAIVAGIMKLAYQQLYAFDVSVFWESILVIVNILQLALIAWDNRKRHFDDEERELLATFEPPLPNAAAAALISVAKWKDAPPNTELTREGEAVGGLVFIASGPVRIDAGGRAVGSCGPGDFLGEMTWQSGAPATGTAVAVGPVRYVRFERRKLQKVLKRRPVLQFALQTSFNRNLIAKLIRANDTK
jgi:hypothetical protein